MMQHDATRLDVTIITGMSGAGRSEAANVLEDLGFFVIDNLPPDAHRQGRRARARHARRRRGTRSSSTCAPASSSHDLDGRARRAAAQRRARRASCSSTRPTTCSSAATRRRRRRHPLVRLRPRQRRHRARAGAARGAEGRGRPRRRHVEPQRARAARPAARAVRRARRRRRGCRSTSCRSATSTASRSTSTSCSTAASSRTRTGSTSCARSPGTDAPVRDYVLEQPGTGEFLDELDRLFALLLPGYVREGKAYLSIGVGCTGGRHRSVVIAEQLAERLAAGRLPGRGAPSRRRSGLKDWRIRARLCCSRTPSIGGRRQRCRPNGRRVQHDRSSRDQRIRPDRPLVLPGAPRPRRRRPGSSWWR